MLRKILYGVCHAGNCYNAYAADYPGCLATGKTVKEARDRLAGALKAHIEGMIEDNEELPGENVDGGFLVVDVAVAPNRKIDGATLRDYRNRLGLTQDELARELEVTKATISEWENGRRELPGTVKFALEAVC